MLPFYANSGNWKNALDKRLKIDYFYNGTAKKKRRFLEKFGRENDVCRALI